MDLKIRKAEKADCPAMLELIRELAEYERAPEEVTVSLAHFEETGFGESPVWWAFVATVTEGGIEKIIGFALYYIRYSTWKGSRMYLEDLLVTEKWRGQGVGAALMEALIQRATAEKLHGISWQVLDWNEPAIRFYKKYNARMDESWINAGIDL